MKNHTFAQLYIEYHQYPCVDGFGYYLVHIPII